MGNRGHLIIVTAIIFATLLSCTGGDKSTDKPDNFIPTPSEVYPTSVRIRPESSAVIVGDTIHLNASIYPENTTKKSLSWTSDKDTIAKVSNTGVVTALKAGSACITAKCQLVSGKSYITVKPEELYVSPSSIRVLANESSDIEVFSNTSWTVMVPSGYVANPTEGKGNGKITITAGANPKEAVLTVKTTRMKQEVYLNRDELSVSPTSLDIEIGSVAQLSISSNINWNIEPLSGYYINPLSGSGNKTVTINAQETAVGGVLKVKANKLSETVTISPPRYKQFSFDPEKLTVPAEASTSSFRVVFGGSVGEWTITMPSPKPSWLISVSPISGIGDATILINTSANPEKANVQTFLTVKSGIYSKSLLIIKEAAKNNPPSKPKGLRPIGNNVETFTTFSWDASIDADPGDKIKYTVMLSKDNSTWISFDPIEKTEIMNKVELEKNTTYYYKVVADDGQEGGRVESDIVTFTTGSTKSYWADGEVKLYEINSDGSITEVTSTSRPFKLIYTGDGYTQDLYKYGGQFDQEIDKGIKALFQIEPYKYYYYYFAVYKVAAYSNEAGMSQGSTDWANTPMKVDTKFKCSWQGGNSTSIGCDTKKVEEYAAKCPGYKGTNDYTTRTNLSWSPICIIINSNQSAGTNIWSSGIGGMKIVSIAQIPARHPSVGSYGGFANTLVHEYGGHGIGLLGDEYVYYSTTAYPYDNQSTFRYWQNLGAYPNSYLPAWDATNSFWYSDYEHCNIGLTHNVEGANWKTFADRLDYAACNINLHAGSATYGVGIYRSENSSCMVDNIPHFNTISRWKIYCRIKITAGETPTVEDFISHDYDKTNSYSSAAPSTKATAPAKKCEGPMLIDPYHKKPYFLK